MICDQEKTEIGDISKEAKKVEEQKAEKSIGALGQKVDQARSILSKTSRKLGKAREEL